MVRVRERVMDSHQDFEQMGELSLLSHYQSNLIFCASESINFLYLALESHMVSIACSFIITFGWRDSHGLRLDSGD